MKRTLTTLAAGALAVGGSLVATQPAHAASPPSYSVMLLQPHGEAIESTARGLNNRGDVIGASLIEVPDSGPFLLHYEYITSWKARSGLGSGNGPSQFASTAFDISGDGRILLQASMTGVVYGDVLDRGSGLSSATSVSENGVVPVNSGGDNSSPYVATSASDMTDLPLPEGTSNAYVTGISEDGRRVAGTAEYRGATVPVVWTDRTPTRLQMPSGATDAGLHAVNKAGTSVGCVLVNGSQRPVRYTASGVPTLLPGLEGHPDTCATVVNDAGVVAGTASTSTTNTAVVWVNGQARDLNTLVAQRSGYTLNSVADINASGQIVGTATLADGTTRGYIATPSTAETIYTSPGYHSFNGRQWKTTCEPYSKTTRCRTEIWASTVTTTNGRHSIANGWAFNNLTYLPSDRALWKNNPLGNTGTWTATDGRNWRTECDTAATGRNGCRSYSRVTVVEAVPKPAGGYTFRQENTFVFNNIVKFTTK